MVDQVTFRTTDLTRWGVGKGTPLTNTEGDINFWVLFARLVELEENPPMPISIANIVVTDSQFIVVLTDSTELGPYALPVATFAYREEGWLNSMTYFAFDLVPVDGHGLFQVLREHVTPASPTEFDPDATDGQGNRLYKMLFGDPFADSVNNLMPALEHAAFGGI